MTVCDKCGSKLGTARFRFTMSSLCFPDDKALVARMALVELDLCGKCCDQIREHEFQKAIYGIVRKGETSA